MKSKSLRIILSGLLLVFVISALYRWLSRPSAESPAEMITVAETEEPPTAPPPRPALWLRSTTPRVTTAPAPIQPPAQPPQKLFVEWKGTWYPAEILASSDGSNYVHYTGYGPQWDEWVTAERMRYSTGESLATMPEVAAPEPAVQETSPETPSTETARMTPMPGDPVVRWGDRWWRAEVLQTDGDHSLIRYVGYGSEWDEWVGIDRFKVYSEEDARNSAPTEIVPQTTALPDPEANGTLVQGKLAKGDLLVEWGQQWWPSEILKQEGGNYFIHYKGYGDHWDEWVTAERLGIYSGDQQEE